MEKFQQYCQILGVLPGDSAEQVKRSFRDLIKRYHPDSAGKESDAAQAQLLIEAYLAFQGGVPQESYFRREAQPFPAEDFVSHAEKKKRAAYWQKENVKSQAGMSYQLRGQEAGHRMFETLFGGEEPTFFHHLLARLAEGGDNGEELYILMEEIKKGKKKGKREKRGKETGEAQYSVNYHYFDRAEAILQEIVFQFDRRSNRFQPSWARDFIRQLVQVQVLYRDLYRLTPNLTAKVRQRLRQVNELITEIRRAFNS